MLTQDEIRQVANHTRLSMAMDILLAVNIPALNLNREDTITLLTARETISRARNVAHQQVMKARRGRQP